MTTTVMFANDEKKAAIRRWRETFIAKAPVTPEERELMTSFGRTRVLIAGPANGEPLVVLHGALASSAHVLPELGDLLRTRRVYALDVIGQSAFSEDRRISLDDDSYGRWVAEACDLLGLGAFDLYGISWGGFVALRTASTFPDRIRHLVLLVPAGLCSSSAWTGFREVGWPIMIYRLFPNDARLERVVRALFTTTDPDWTRYFGEALLAYKLDMRVPPQLTPKAVAAIRCPVLVFGADEDASFPGAALVERAKRILPHAEVELIEGSKHCPPTTAPFRAKMAERIETFLSR